MSGGSHIVAVGPGNDRSDTPKETAKEAQDEVLALEETWEEPVETRPSSRFGWVIPALAMLTVAGWTGLFVVAQKDILLAGGTLQQWTGWITSWAIPVLLVVAIWLLAMRTSSREAQRFGDAAKLLAEESLRLENRLTIINRELSLARDFIAAQSRDLESLGRVASERLSQNAAHLAGLIIENGKQIDSIASVSTTALENMNKLRGDLPVIANSARDVTSQIGNAGRTAHGQLEELIKGFHRLNEFGEASAKHFTDLRGKLIALRGENEEFAALLRDGENEAVGQWGTAISGMRERLAEALSEIDEINKRVLGRAHERLEAVGEWAKAVESATDVQIQTFMEAMEQKRTAQAIREADEIAALERQLAVLDSGIAERQQAHLAHVGHLALCGDELTAQLTKLGGHIEAIGNQGSVANHELAQSIELLAGKIAANRGQLAETDKAVSDLTDASVRLLELIQASSEHSRSQLPQALEAARASLTEFEERTKAAGLMLDEASRKGKELSDYVVSAQGGSADALQEVEAFYDKLAHHGGAQVDRIEALRASIAALSQESEDVAGRAQGDLTGAIEKLQTALSGTIAQLDRDSSDAIEQIALEVGTKSAEAFDNALRAKTTEAIGELEAAAAHASGVSREAARQLRDQLSKVNELAGNLESRVQRARERAEEEVDNDFARRVALITESLNSNAIDIAKALSNDVTDTAWASYLRGDRGIFTRRAVRLLDNSQAREIAEIYDRDHDFREHVTRYIHDFEAMLRTMLSTRDGNALGVTLLSSDMGKLYVALAQAIERLRA